jgi:HD-GYP domain-containing protein (c-di-GMP phosphodiesterase class II)
LTAVNELTEIPIQTTPADPAAAGIVDALVRAVELHDYRRGSFGENAAHIERVTKLACRLTERVAPELATDVGVVAGFRLHDIGMIGIPAHVLSKPGPLTADELSEIREHPWLGERIVAPVEFLNGLARHVIGCHHERWDGTGYPRGLRGVEIPLPARIFAVADAYDAMTNAQPYRPALDPDAAVSEIEGKAATHFDPQVVTALLAWHAEQRDGS